MRMLQGLLKSFVVAFLLTALAASPALAGALRVDISPVRDSVANAGEGVALRFTVTNPTSEDIFILAYETPLQGFERDLLQVRRDGEPIPYIGLLALRIGPAEQDWLRIPAGESITGEFDLAQGYDLRRPGTYTIGFQGRLQVFRGEGRRLPPIRRISDMDDVEEEIFRLAVATAEDQQELLGVAVSSPLCEVSIQGDYEFPEADPEPGDELMAFYGCSSTSTLTTAQSTARSRAARAYNAIPSYNTFYRTWFGTTSSYVSTVRGRFYNSYTRLGQTVDYYCGSYAPYCQSNYIAYTYKTTSNRIYICAAFWNQSASSKAHTIAHESFHWNTVAGADDVTYGYTNCQNLAKTRPYDALRNADNYAYATTYAP